MDMYFWKNSFLTLGETVIIESKNESLHSMYKVMQFFFFR